MNNLSLHEKPPVPELGIEPLVNCQWVAEALGMSRARVYDALNKRQIPANAVHRIGRSVRFRPEIIRAWIEGGCQKQTPATSEATIEETYARR